MALLLSLELPQWPFPSFQQMPFPSLLPPPTQVCCARLLKKMICPASTINTILPCPHFPLFILWQIGPKLGQRQLGGALSERGPADTSPLGSSGPVGAAGRPAEGLGLPHSLSGGPLEHPPGGRSVRDSCKGKPSSNQKRTDPKP